MILCKSEQSIILHLLLHATLRKENCYMIFERHLQVIDSLFTILSMADFVLSFWIAIWDCSFATLSSSSNRIFPE